MTATQPVALVTGASRTSDNSRDASNPLGAAPRDGAVLITGWGTGDPCDSS
jgi:hypothetical protein